MICEPLTACWGVYHVHLSCVNFVPPKLSAIYPHIVTQAAVFNLIMYHCKFLSQRSGISDACNASTASFMPHISANKNILNGMRGNSKQNNYQRYLWIDHILIKLFFTAIGSWTHWEYTYNLLMHMIRYLSFTLPLLISFPCPPPQNISWQHISKGSLHWNFLNFQRAY